MHLHSWLLTSAEPAIWASYSSCTLFGHSTEGKREKGFIRKSKKHTLGQIKKEQSAYIYALLTSELGTPTTNSSSRGNNECGEEKEFLRVCRARRKKEVLIREDTHPSSLSSFRTIPFSRSVRSFRPKIGHRRPYDVQKGWRRRREANIITQPAQRRMIKK